MPPAPAAPPPLVCLVGSTASGKSALALEVAERAGAELVCCDSVTVYRGLDVGSAKPSPAERARVPHHALDVAEPTEPFTAARWVEVAERAIADVRARGKVPLVVGGTGLYLRALVEGLFEAPPPDPALRARLLALPTEELARRVAEGDPEAARKIAPADRVRLSRALEVLEQTGRPISAWQAESRARGPRHAALLVGLDPPREVLYPRIDARVEAMMAAGWLDEVRALVARFGPDARALGALGYRTLVQHLRDELPLDNAVAVIQRETRNFAHRQRTWFRAMEVRWADGPDTAVVGLQALLRKVADAY